MSQTHRDLLILAVWTVGLLIGGGLLFKPRSEPVHKRAQRVARQSAQRRAARRRRALRGHR